MPLTMTFDNLHKYYTEFYEHFKKGEMFALPNMENAQKAIILRLMLEVGEVVNIYCRDMSVFEKQFYSDINFKYGNNIGAYLRDKVTMSLQHFFHKCNSKINIIIRTGNPDLKNVLIDSLLFKYNIKNGKISVFKVIEDRIPIEAVPHFSFNDSGIARVEQDMEESSGICAVHIPENLRNNLQNNFEILRSVSLPYVVNFTQ